MGGLLSSFRDCGWPAWLCLLIGFLGAGSGSLGLLLGALRKPLAARVFGAMTLVLGLLAVTTGFVGQSLGNAQTEAALSGDSVTPDQKALIRAEGTREASQCVPVGAGTAALPLLLGALGIGLGFASQKKATGTPPTT
jgi:hypothetical protein